MKLKILYIFVSLFLFSSCFSKYKYWDITKFKMDENVLQDGDGIKLVYSSQAPDNNKNLEYYIHIIAVSQKSGDTINILTTINNGFQSDVKDKVFTFMSKDSEMGKVLQNISYDNDYNLSKVDKSKLKPITKVVRDPRFDYLADNNFPTIIGFIGQD